jgi:XTP/dITP diphosphohydrolase
VGIKNILIASRNPGKIMEVRALLRDSGVAVKSLEDYPDLPEVNEDGDSFLENALKKGRVVAGLTGEIVIADDSGLEVAALKGAPGIHSARYAGEGADDRKNILKLLGDMQGIPSVEREAVFRCVLALCWPAGHYHAFVGLWKGRIADAPAGQGGFGYDPVFFLPERGMTVSELPAGVKNRISHRAKAMEKLSLWLREN